MRAEIARQARSCAARRRCNAVCALLRREGGSDAGGPTADETERALRAAALGAPNTALGEPVPAATAVGTSEAVSSAAASSAASLAASWRASLCSSFV